MTNKEIAEIIRRGQQDELDRLVDELDPPLPEPETVVWCHQEPWPSDQWEIATSAEQGVYITGHGAALPWDSIQWKPARILADDEVAVKVPSEFPDGSDEASLRWHYESNYDWMTDYAGVSITRAEAEAREAE
jgi:hypothetical protein